MIIDMTWEGLNEERLKQIIRQISGKSPKSEDELIKPSYINCKGRNKEEKWFWVPSQKAHKRLVCGTKVYIVDYEFDELDRVLIYDGNFLFAIPYEELEEIGFN
tara:strand:+ start:1156 stop:1467 length:312 start_codon:yes stop_codon:yes gene_type:complete